VYHFSGETAYPLVLPTTILDVIPLESNTFSMYVQTVFIHTTPKAISSGTLSDRCNHDHRIKPIYDNDDDGHGDDKTYSFTEKSLGASSSFVLFIHFPI